jgi:hypothetical protein
MRRQQVQIAQNPMPMKERYLKRFPQPGFGAPHSPILPKRKQLRKSDCFQDRYSGRRPQRVLGTDFLSARG